jgi:hypothetical protein
VDALWWSLLYLSGGKGPGDSLAPGALGGIDMQAASDLGDSNSDNKTSDTTPTFDITLHDDNQDGDVIGLYINTTPSFGGTPDDTEDAGTTAVDPIAATPAVLAAGHYYAAARAEREVLGVWHYGPFTSPLEFWIGDATAPTYSTATTANVTDDIALSHTITTNQSTTKAITGGADAAHFELVSGEVTGVSHTLRWLSNGTRDFDAPTDADANNTYVVQVTSTNNTEMTANQTITITVVAVGGVGDDILMETGDHLLLESGDLILLE